MRNNESNKKQIILGLFWRFMERGGTQGIQFIVQIVLARLLLPEDYGILALVIIFINIASVFVQSGFNKALIQKKNVDEIDFSSVFYLSLTVAIILYIIIFYIAQFVANFFEEPILIPVLRVLSLTLFLGVYISIQNAIIIRNLDFKRLFYSSISGILVSGITGIYMAYSGYGIWALVGQQLVNQLLVLIILCFTVRWRPRMQFSITRAQTLFSFGWKILVASLIDIIYIDIRSLIIGKMYNPAMLGFYNRGQQFPASIANNFNGSIQTVMFPVLSSHQNNIPRVKDIARRTIVTSSFIIFPMMIGLAVTAEPLVKILLTDKWLPCVPFMQIFCVSFALWPINSTNLQSINALGRSDIFLKLETIKKVIGLTILVVTVFYGVYAIAFGQLLTELISTIINIHPNQKFLNYSYKEQFRDIIPPLLLSLVMGTVVFSITWFGMTVLLTFIIQVCVGILLYVGMAWLLKLECFKYLVLSIKEVL